MKMNVVYNDSHDVVDVSLEKNRKRRALKRSKQRNYKHHLKQIADISGCPAGATFDDDRNCVMRTYKGKYATWVKRVCNRKFRRTNIVSRSRCIQRKYTEYWWEIA